LGRGICVVCETRARQSGIATAGRRSVRDYSDCFLGSAHCGLGGRVQSGEQVAVDPM